MMASVAERQRQYRQQHLGPGGQKVRINLVVDRHDKVILDRLATAHGITKSEALSRALDQAELALLDMLDAAQRKDYYAGKLLDVVAEVRATLGSE